MGLRPDAERGVPGELDTPDKDAGRPGGLAAGSRPRGAIMGGGGTASRSPSQIPFSAGPQVLPDPPRSPSQIDPGVCPESPRSLSPILPGACPGCPPSARSPPGIPPVLVPVLVRPARHRTSPSRVGSGTLGFTGSAARPSAGTHETRRRVSRSDPLPAAVPALCLAPGRRPRASALASPWCARSLPEPGLIWSRWRQAVGTAQPPQPACQYPAHNPPAARPRSHAHRARPLPLRDPLQIPRPRLPPTLVPA